uniref:PEP-CTERM putative exosortase interaction domain-containing protein n=1 Tax=Desulfovibrio sp. U5L TaxID=596152 RepID=I2Q4K0_9BACT
MRYIFKFLVAVMVLAMSTQAQASFILDFSQFTGGSVVNSANPLSSVSFATSSTISQSLGADGVLSSGDPFSQAALTDYSTGYTSSLTNLFTVSLGGNGQLLTIKAPVLTGVLTTSGGTPGSFYYVYNVPASGIEIYYSNTAGTGETLIGSATLIAPSGGLNTDSINGTFNTGTFHLFADLDTLTSGIFKSADGTDLASYLTDGYIVRAELAGHINLTSSSINASDPNNPIINANFTNGGEFSIAATPEPGTMLLMGLGTLGAAVMRRRNRARSC